MPRRRIFNDTEGQGLSFEGKKELVRLGVGCFESEYARHFATFSTPFRACTLGVEDNPKAL